MLVRHTQTPPITLQRGLCGCQPHVALLMLPNRWRECCVCYIGLAWPANAW